MRPMFPRRSSWLYPDDGCYARAQLINRNLLQWMSTAPKKIFVFGDLNVKTANSPYGEVTWWYHVAPIVQVQGVKFVLDPSVDPIRPLKLEEWLSAMAANPGELEVAVCGSGSYTPLDSCDKEANDKEPEAERDQAFFLSPEWERVENLGRDPEKELGDDPPWN